MLKYQIELKSCYFAKVRNIRFILTVGIKNGKFHRVDTIVLNKKQAIDLFWQHGDIVMTKSIVAMSC